MTEEAKSLPWLKVFSNVGLSRVWGKVKSRVKVGTKRVCSKFVKRCGYLFMGKEVLFLIMEISYRTFFYVFVTWVLCGKRRTTHKTWIAASVNIRQ